MKIGETTQTKGIYLSNNQKEKKKKVSNGYTTLFINNFKINIFFILV